MGGWADENWVRSQGSVLIVACMWPADAPAFQLFNRVTWFPGDLSAFAAAAGAMFRCSHYTILSSTIGAEAAPLNRCLSTILSLNRASQ